MSEPLTRRGDPAGGYYCVETEIRAAGLGSVTTKACGPEPSTVQAIDRDSFYRNAGLGLAVSAFVVAAVYLGTREEPAVLKEARRAVAVQRERDAADRRHAQIDTMLAEYGLM